MPEQKNNNLSLDEIERLADKVTNWKDDLLCTKKGLLDYWIDKYLAKVEIYTGSYKGVKFILYQQRKISGTMDFCSISAKYEKIQLGDYSSREYPRVIEILQKIKSKIKGGEWQKISAEEAIAYAKCLL